MELSTIILGVTVALFGLYTFVVRIKAPDKFIKLSAMKDKFGNAAGTTIHTIAYSIVPLVFGGILVNAGVNGISIMQFMAS